MTAQKANHRRINHQDLIETDNLFENIAAFKLENFDPNNVSDKEALIAEHQTFILWIINRILKVLPISPADYYDLKNDLFLYGVVGLLDAASRYDADRKIKFTTFAYHRVRGEVQNGLKKMRPEFISFLKNLDMEEFNSVNETKYHNFKVDRSYDKPILEHFESSFANLVEDSEIFSSTSDRRYHLPPTKNLQVKGYRKILSRAWSNLAEIEREIIIRHYIKDETLSEIGMSINYSTSWVSRTLKQSLKYLRERICAENKVTTLDQLL